MAEEMTLVPKNRYENMLKQLESLKSINKAQKSERSNDDISSDTKTSPETVLQKEEKETPHYYVEKTFKQLFTEEPNHASNKLSDQQSIQSSRSPMQSIKFSKEMKIPAKSKNKRKTSKLLQGLPDSASCKLKRQVHKSGRFLSKEFKREKVNSTSNRKLKRQDQKSKRSLSNAEEDFRREKQNIWINYLV